MKLGQFSGPKKKPRKRVGRGVGSGHGKTSGRGHKGYGQRSGAKRRPWFEGGQMPLQRRLPKRGFRNLFRRAVATVNLRDLAGLAVEGPITIDVMRKHGLVKGQFEAVKVLGVGEIDRPLTVEAHAFSAAARQRIVAAGGTAQVVEQ